MREQTGGQAFGRAQTVGKEYLSRSVGSIQQKQPLTVERQLASSVVRAREQFPDWQPRRIAIFRALQLGDLLLAVPALRAIRKRFPHAEITFIGLPWARSFVHRYSSYLDRFVEFRGYPGINEVPVDAERTTRFLKEQQEYGYDLAIQMHGSGRTSNAFVLALNAQVSAGYYDKTLTPGLALAAPYPDDCHEIFRNLGVAALVGAEDLSTRLEFPLYEEDYSEAATLLRQLPHAGRPWIALHPGSRPPARRWPPEYFARVADELAYRYGAQILLTGGPGEESTVQAVIERMETEAINLAGKTSLGGLGALISKLDLFISNDTGPAHVAIAVECPSIALFGPADYSRWAALDQQRHPALRVRVACSPCGHWECPIDHRCLRWLEPSQVLTVADRFLHTVSLPERIKSGELYDHS